MTPRSSDYALVKAHCLWCVLPLPQLWWLCGANRNQNQQRIIFITNINISDCMPPDLMGENMVSFPVGGMLTCVAVGFCLEHTHPWVTVSQVKDGAMSVRTVLSASPEPIYCWHLSFYDWFLLNQCYSRFYFAAPTHKQLRLGFVKVSPYPAELGVEAFRSLMSPIYRDMTNHKRGVI